MKRSSTAAEKRHLARIAGMGCCVCSHVHGLDEIAAEVHHVRVKHGWGRSSHFDTIPLCSFHHRNGRLGVHGMGREEFAAMYGVSEIGLLNLTKEKLGITE